jgi:DNA modification methylase
MTQPSFVTFPYGENRDAGPFHDQDDRFSENYVRHFIDRFTKKNNRVFDPFAGLGTSMFIAEEMGRIPYGIEADKSRYEWTAGQIEHWQNMICDDAANVDDYKLPKMDFMITSPPFMARDHKWNPLSGGDKAQDGYTRYLEQMEAIFKSMRSVMKKNAHMLIHLDNIHSRVFTPLVWDVGAVISKHFKLEDDIIVHWSDKKSAQSHTHGLLFKNTRL